MPWPPGWRNGASGPMSLASSVQVRLQPGRDVRSGHEVGELIGILPSGGIRSVIAGCGTPIGCHGKSEKIFGDPPGERSLIRRATAAASATCRSSVRRRPVPLSTSKYRLTPAGHRDAAAPQQEANARSSARAIPGRRGPGRLRSVQVAWFRDDQRLPRLEVVRRQAGSFGRCGPRQCRSPRDRTVHVPLQLRASLYGLSETPDLVICLPPAPARSERWAYGRRNEARRALRGAVSLGDRQIDLCSGLQEFG